jgi:nitrogen fixation protein NifU and related proteins
MNYTKEVMEHFMNPRNVGEIKDADGVGEVGNPACGDIMWIYIKVADNRIADIKFKTLGCAAAIAISSKTTEIAKGMSIEDALKLSNKKIVDSLGGLPPVKIHCSVLAVDALKEAIYDYYKKKNIAITESMEKNHQRIAKEKCDIEGMHEHLE